MLEQISRARLRPGKNKKLQHYTADECAALFQYPSPEENDGPSMCWLVSHSHTTYSNHSLGFTFRPEFQCLRRVGYVMWDVKRIESERLLPQSKEIFKCSSPEEFAQDPGNDEDWEKDAMRSLELRRSLLGGNI